MAKREVREPTKGERATANRGMVAMAIREAMSYGRPVELVAGSRYSCKGRIERLENDPRQVPGEGGSTLTAFVRTPGGLMDVPVSAVTEVKPAL